MVNPYSPPGSAVADVKEPGTQAQFTVPGIRVGAGRGASWLGEGWALFRAAPLLWIVTLVILLGMQLLLNLIPLFGPIAGYLLYPAFMVGILAFAKGIAESGQADVGNLFAGFREKLGPLVAVGGIYLLMLAVLVVVFLVILFASIGVPASFDADSLQQLARGEDLLGMLLAFLVAMALAVPVMAAYWFAPGLVYYADLGAWAAMKESLWACLRNWLPFLIYGVLALLAFMLLGIPLGMLAASGTWSGIALGIAISGFLAVFVLLPVLMASYYSSFLDLFGKKG